MQFVSIGTQKIYFSFYEFQQMNPAVKITSPSSPMNCASSDVCCLYLCECLLVQKKLNTCQVAASWDTKCIFFVSGISADESACENSIIL